MRKTARVPTITDFERMLREVALRVTRPRLAVLAAVHGQPHADTDSIIGAVRADLGGVSHQAVYDVLRALTTAGLLRRIEPPGSVARYEARVGTTTTTPCAGRADSSPTSIARSAPHPV